MSNPTRSASMGTMPVSGNKNIAADKRPPYKAPTVLTYTDDRHRRELDLGQVTQGLRPKNA